MILCIDVGGSRMKWGLAGPHGWVKRGDVANAQIGTLILRDWQNLPRPERVVGVNTAGEAQRVRVEGQLARWRASVRWIKPAAKGGGVINDYRQGELAPDRWVSLIAARRRAVSAANADACVVVNAGACVTIDSLDSDGRFRGGVMLPGLATMRKALAEAMPLARTSGGQRRDFPVNDADGAATGGVRAVSGAVALTRDLIAQQGAPVRVFIGGGAAGEIAPHLAAPVEVVDNLVLEGVLALAD
ncbi:MAG: type III pantothenate kinase [Casimicrobiaceae bacterium]